MLPSTTRTAPCAAYDCMRRLVYGNWPLCTLHLRSNLKSGPPYSLSSDSELADGSPPAPGAARPRARACGLCGRSVDRDRGPRWRWLAKRDCADGPSSPHGPLYQWGLVV